MTRIAKIAGFALLVCLAGCGKVGPLEPKSGQAPPAKAYGQAETPTSEALMTASEQARPGRSDELMRRSERRENDPFDLPPGSEAEPAKDKEAATAPPESATPPK